MPTDIDVKLAEDLADFRLETEKRFGSIEKELGEFRAEVRTQLGFIKWIGGFFAGVLVLLVTSLIGVAWNAGTVVSEVRNQAGRIGELKAEAKAQGARLDGIDAKLDILIRRAESKAKGE
jgi:hypothetical protein